MSGGKHTPGPLTVSTKSGDPDDLWFKIVSDYKNVPAEQFEDVYVSFHGFFGSYGPHMFAAAPDLLAALKALLIWYLDGVNSGEIGGDWKAETEAEVIAARAAIAKAEGGAA